MRLAGIHATNNERAWLQFPARGYAGIIPFLPRKAFAACRFGKRQSSYFVEGQEELRHSCSLPRMFFEEHERQPGWRRLC
jgi:hypothetical protein